MAHTDGPVRGNYGGRAGCCCLLLLCFAELRMLECSGVHSWIIDNEQITWTTSLLSRPEKASQPISKATGEHLAHFRNNYQRTDKRKHTNTHFYTPTFVQPRFILPMARGHPNHIVNLQQLLHTQSSPNQGHPALWSIPVYNEWVERPDMLQHTFQKKLISTHQEMIKPKHSERGAYQDLIRYPGESNCWLVIMS